MKQRLYEEEYTQADVYFYIDFDKGYEAIDENIMLHIPGEEEEFYLLDYFSKPVLRVSPEKSVVLSRDDLRAELGFCKKGDKIVGTKYQEDKVTKVFNDRLKEAAEEGKHIIIDAINIKKEYRVRICEFLANYNIIVNYVYVETEGLDTNIARRKGQVGKDVFDGMIERFEFPTPDEYDNFYVFINNDKEGWKQRN